jgi:hypothetical protein
VGDGDWAVIGAGSCIPGANVYVSFAVMGHAGTRGDAYVSVSRGHGGCAGRAHVIVDSEEGC